MSTRHVSPAELKRLFKGSLARHESLVEAVRVKLTLARLPAVPIYTGGIPYPVGEGLYRLRENPHQQGLCDLLSAARDAEHPGGRGVFLEMKTGGARLSAVQLAMRRQFEALGFLALAVRSAEDVDPIIAADLRVRRGAA